MTLIRSSHSYTDHETGWDVHTYGDGTIVRDVAIGPVQVFYGDLGFWAKEVTTVETAERVALRLIERTRTALHT